MESTNRSNPAGPAKITRRNQPARKTAVKLEPLPPDSGQDVWISARQACSILGVRRGAIYKLIESETPVLLSRRPLPRKVLISLLSVKAFAEATKNPEFWQSAQLQDEYQQKLKGIPNG